MDMEKYPTVKEQWDVISALFAAKSKYAKTDLVLLAAKPDLFENWQ